MDKLALYEMLLEDHPLWQEKTAGARRLARLKKAVETARRGRVTPKQEEGVRRMRAAYERARRSGRKISPERQAKYDRTMKTYESRRGQVSPKLQSAYDTAQRSMERRVDKYNRATTTLADPLAGKPMGVKDVGFNLPHGGFVSRSHIPQLGRAGTATSPPTLHQMQAMRGEGSRMSALRVASRAEKAAITRRFNARYRAAEKAHSV